MVIFVETHVEVQKKHFMKHVYDFLARLAKNNNREWFEAHKDEYLAAKEIFDNFTKELIREISRWDPYIDHRRLTVQDCTYRIYRDLRFSKDKTPYKTHIGCFITHGGKKSQYPGYYFHMEPPESGSFLGGNILFAGIYMPEPKVIASIRDEISVNGDALIKAINKAKGFVLQYNALRRVPAGYEKVEDEGWRNLIKLKEISMFSNVSENFLFARGNLAKRVSERFRYCKDLNLFLNRCVDYAMEGNI